MSLWCGVFFACMLFSGSRQAVDAELNNITITVSTQRPKIHSVQQDDIMIQANSSDNCKGLNWFIANRTTLTLDIVLHSADASAPVYRVDNLNAPSRLYIYNSRIAAKVSVDVIVLSCDANDTVLILRYDQLPSAPSTQLAPSTETTLVPTASVVQPTPTQDTPRPSASTSAVQNNQPVTVTTAAVITGSAVLLIVVVPLVLVVLWLACLIRRERKVTKVYDVAGPEMAGPIEMASGQNIAEH